MSVECTIVENTYVIVRTDELLSEARVGHYCDIGIVH